MLPQRTFYDQSPETRSDVFPDTPYLRDVAPIIQIPFHLPQDEEGLEVNVDLGSTSAFSVAGFIQSPYETGYQPRAKIRFTSLELFESTGSYQVETNNDTQGLFRSNLLPGRYLMDIIPPFGEYDGASPLQQNLKLERMQTWANPAESRNDH